jgi:glycosyltransferase involved in cell wall biosynthesis
MKIVYDYSIFTHQPLGGISRYFVNLNHIIKKNNKSIILAPIHFNKFLNSYKDYKGIFINKFPKYTSKIFKIYNESISKKFLSNFKPDIFHKTYYNNFSPKNFSGKRIITVYDLIHEKFYKDFGYKENYRPKTNSLQNSDLIIAISNKTKSDLIEYYNIPPEKIFVTHLGINTLPKTLEYNLVEKPYILFVGDRKRYKNFTNLLKAYSISKKINKNFKLILFGGGQLLRSEFDIINKYSVDLNSITQISGNDNELSSLYKHANLFIFPSKYEGFGLPLLEAAWQNCPIACSDIEVFREIMGNSVKYFNPDSVDDIIKNLEEILFSNSLSQKLIAKASNQLLNYSWDKCAKETLEIYNL